MVGLIANTLSTDLVPKIIGAVTLTEVDAGQITLIARFKKQQTSVSKALKSAFGLGFLAPNRMLGTTPGVLWCGMGQALLMGATCPDMPAACVDHSDAWTIVRVDGKDAVSVLARLTPIDLRDAVFKRGHTARTLIGHMTAGITRVGAALFEVMAMRSMAATLVHDLERAAENVASRVKLLGAD